MTTTLQQELDTLLPRISMLVDAPAILEHLVALRDRLKTDPNAANMLTVDDARARVLRGRGAGMRCPVCEQHVKIYRRPLSREMVGCLLQIIQIFIRERDWVECRRLKRQGGDYGKLAHWDLIEFETTKLKRRRQNGRVRPTQLGIRFALAQVAVPSHMLLYNTNKVGVDDTKQVMIHDVAGFNYDEIMAAVRGAENLSW